MREIIDTSRISIAQKRFGLEKFAKILNDAYTDTERSNKSDEYKSKAKKSFAPSGVGYGSGTCPRQWFYAFTGGVVREDDVDSMAIANMDNGSFTHERIQTVFERTGLLVEKEKKVVCEDPKIFGFADLVINWQGEEVVGEIKTTSQESFVSKQAKQKPAGYHLLQVLIYMKVLGYNKGFLLYENKNTQALLLLPVTWNEDNKKLIEDTFAWMKSTYANWEAGTKPTRPFTQKSIACKSCPFYVHCWEDEDAGVVKLSPLVVPK